MLRILSICVVGMAVVLSSGCSDKKSSAPSTTSTAGRKQFSHADFEKMVKDKSANEVVSAIGQPDRKNPVSFTDKEEWIYIGLTTNPETSKPDMKVTLTIEKGRVVKIDYAATGGS